MSRACVRLTRSKWLLAVPSLAGILLVLIATSRYGAGLSPDSVNYISAARSLINGEGYLRYDGSPFVQWPPLFPTLLGVLGLGVLDPLDTARYLNAVVFGLIVFSSSWWLWKHGKSAVSRLVGCSAVLLSRPLLEVSKFAWSEPLFALFLVMFFFAIEDFLTGDRLCSLLLSGVCAALSCLTRYVGIAAVLTGLAVLMLGRCTPIRRRLIDAALFGFISVLPTAIWLARNMAVCSTLFGGRSSSPWSLAQSIRNTLATLSSWFLGDGIPATAGMFLTMLCLLAAVGHFLRGTYWRQVPEYVGYRSILCFVVIYTTLIIASATVVAFDPLGGRLLSPIYVPLVLLLCGTIDHVVETLAHSPDKRMWSRALSGLLVLWTLVPLLGSVRIITKCVQDGAGGYNSRLFKESELLKYLSQNPPKGPVLSNAPDALYVLLDMEARDLPSKPRGLPLIKEILDSSANGTAYLVWFHKKAGGSRYTANDLAFVFSVEEIARFPDGIVYLFTDHFAEVSSGGVVLPVRSFDAYQDMSSEEWDAKVSRDLGMLTMAKNGTITSAPVPLDTGTYRVMLHGRGTARRQRENEEKRTPYIDVICTREDGTCAARRTVQLTDRVASNIGPTFVVTEPGMYGVQIIFDDAATDVAGKSRAVYLRGVFFQTMPDYAPLQVRLSDWLRTHADPEQRVAVVRELSLDSKHLAQVAPQAIRPSISELNALIGDSQDIAYVVVPGRLDKGWEGPGYPAGFPWGRFVNGKGKVAAFDEGGFSIVIARLPDALEWIGLSLRESGKVELPLASFDADPNLLANGQFDEGKPPWKHLTATDKSDVVYGIDESSGWPPPGVKIVGHTDEYHGGWFQKISLPAGTPLYYRARVKTESVDGLRASLLAWQLGPEVEHLTYRSGSRDWTMIESGLTVPEPGIQTILFAPVRVWGVGTVWLDDVSLTVRDGGMIVMGGDGRNSKVTSKPMPLEAGTYQVTLCGQASKGKSGDMPHIGLSVLQGDRTPIALREVKLSDKEEHHIGPTFAVTELGEFAVQMAFPDDAGPASGSVYVRSVFLEVVE